MRRRAAWAGAMLVVFSLVLAAIGGVTSLGKAQPMFINTPTPVGAVESTPTPTEPAVQPLKIGAVLAISGPNSSMGIAQRDTLLQQEEELNAQGGIAGRPVEVIIRDGESDEVKTLAAVKKLIEEDDVLAIIGPSDSGPTLSVVSTVEKSGVPLISLGARSTISQPVKQWVFQVVPSDALAMNQILDYLKSVGKTRIAFIHDNSAFGLGGRDLFGMLLQDSGITATTTQVYKRDSQDLTEQLTQIKDSNAQAVVVWGTDPGAALVATEMKRLGLAIPLVESHGAAEPEFLKLAGPAAEGVVMASGKLLVYDSLPANDPQKWLIASYVKSFKDKYGYDTNTFGGYVRDAFQLVVAALEKAGPDRGKVRDAIEGTKKFDGATGTFNFSPTDHNGLGANTVVMIKVVDGAWALVR